MTLGLLVLRRLAAAGAVLAVLSAVIFLATDVLPGDAAGVLAGADATTADRAELSRRLHLDESPVTRYLHWAGDALHGDLGQGQVGGRAVNEVLGDTVPNSLALTVLALALALPCAVLLGLVTAARLGGRADRAVSLVTLAAAGLPEFVTAALLAWAFGALLGILPRVSLVDLGERPWESPEVMVLPALTLAIVATAIATRLLRSSAADVAAAPYVRAARLRGVHGLRLALRHLLPASFAPTAQVVAVLFGGLLGGAVVVESVFNYPGVGFELAQAVANRDVPMVQGLSLALCALALLGLLCGDVVAAVVDPRTRRGR